MQGKNSQYTYFRETRDAKKDLEEPSKLVTLLINALNHSKVDVDCTRAMENAAFLLSGEYR